MNIYTYISYLLKHDVVRNGFQEPAMFFVWEHLFNFNITQVQLFYFKCFMGISTKNACVLFSYVLYTYTCTGTLNCLFHYKYT